MSETNAASQDREQAITSTLERWFGFSTLRPLQREAIDAALDGADALVVLPTGGGKSLCYQLPPLLQDRLTVVVSPLIALMQDQVDGLRLQGVPAAAAHSNLDAQARNELRQLAASGDLRLLFVAPERLFSEPFLRWLRGQDVAAIAIDEAHCISQWGHDFRPEYRRLAELREMFPQVPFHAYTATATPRVQQDILAQLQLREPRVLVGTFDRPELNYRVLPRQDLATQVFEAIARHPDAAAIVYCIARKDTESLATELRRRGVAAVAYHAGLAAGERTKISADFRAERVHVVVATVAFGMGIDRSDVRLVVHAAMPKSIEHYQQETGRGGRDGLPAECLLLYSAADAAKWRMLTQRRSAEGGGDPAATAAQLALLAEMQRFAGRARCRHRALSEYFGQAYTEDNCGACDVCRNELQEVPGGNEVAQKILSAVLRTQQRYGGSYIVEVLRGGRSEKVRQRGHDQIPTFGLLKDVPAMQLGNYIDQLIDLDLLVRSEGEYPILMLGSAARAVLVGERQVTLLAPKAGLEARARRRRSRDGAAESRDLEPAERQLFDVLRGLRREIASELGVPPYVVFGDATLEELAQVRPSSAQGLLGVKGVGQKKLDAFGERFLETIAVHCEATDLALDASRGSGPRAFAPPAARPPRAAGAESVSPRPSPEGSVARSAAEALFEQGMSIDRVAVEIGRADSTTAQYLGEWIVRRRPSSIDPWVSPKVQEQVAAALAACPGGRLKPVFDALGGAVDYLSIRLVAAHRAADGDAAEQH